MKHFMDTEFMEDGHTIDLLSIGIVSEDGRSLYLESSEADMSKANEWVKKNVIPKLNGVKHSRTQIRDLILDFVGDDPVFWGYYCDYDWVAFCQLFGRMIDLPKHFPMYCNDLKQLAGKTRMAQNNSNHNALSDAHWIKSAYESIVVKG